MHNYICATSLGKVIPWCRMEIRMQCLANRENPDFRERSRRNTKNRMKRPSLHSQGFVSTTEVKMKLANKINRDPTAPEMFYHTRMKKNAAENSDGCSYTDDRAREEMEYNRLLKEYMEANNITSPRDVPAQIQNDFYLSVVGWRKGNVLGLSSDIDSYCEEPRPSASVSSSCKMTMELEDARR